MSEQDNRNNALMEAVNALREQVQSKKNDSETLEKIEKINGVLDKFEQENQELVKRLAQSEKQAEEFKERCESIEKHIVKPLNNSNLNNKERSLEQKTMLEYAYHGKEKMPVEYKKYLRTDIDVQGGYLVPPEYIEEIIKKITEYSPIRQYAKVRTTSRKQLELPKRQENVTSYWEGEGQNITSSQEQYGLEIITVHKLTTRVKSTWELISESIFNIETEINDDAMESMAKAEGTAFVLGNGVNQPEGLLTNPAVDVYDSVSAGVLKPEDLINLTGQLKQGYNGSFMFNRRTLAVIRQMVGTNGQFIWTPSLAQGEPNTINGDPYILAIDIPDVETGNTPVIYGDWLKAYCIVDHTKMGFLRDDSSQASTGVINFYFFSFNGGQVVLPEAMNKLLII